MRATFAAAILLVLSATPVLADCPAHFAGGVPPEISRPGLDDRSATICYSAFAVLHSGLSRTALWSAERVTAASVAAARAVDRVDRFHEEERVAAQDRALLADYRGSGLDRGHLAPSANMPDAVAQAESFTLANMVPQDPGTNRGAWARVEASTRELATAYGEVYVVTGPVFASATLRSLNGRVLVPTHVYKAVLIPSVGMAGAWIATNDGTDVVELASVARVEELTGIDPFPAIADAYKASAVALPLPGGAASVSNGPARDEPAAGGNAERAKAVIDAAATIWRMTR